MNKVCHDIFRAIHEGKWLRIEYENKANEITKFWIGICQIDVKGRRLVADALNISNFQYGERYSLFIDKITASELVDGSYCPVNKSLVDDILMNPHKYKSLFDNVANLKILNYLEMCNRMDTTPYYSEFALVKKLDRDSFTGETFPLSTEQFQEVVKHFRFKMDEKRRDDGRLRIQQLAMNVLSINTQKGLYVLAYRKLNLDIKNRTLRPDKEITICTEYIFGENKESIRKYMDADEFELLEDYEKNQEKIKDCIAKHTKLVMGVDDMPYIIGIGMDVVIDLHGEYQSIVHMYEDDTVTVPIKAFFGDLLAKPVRNKVYPMALLNANVNLDQLLAIHNGMKYPLAYIQGPPGTGKTNTIINTIVTAFFNDRTVLFASYNNHPISGVFDKLSTMTFRGKTIPFPVLRLGNMEKVEEALCYIKQVYKQAKGITVYDGALDKRKDDRKERAKKLSVLLEEYERVLELKDRKEAIQRVMEHQKKNMLEVQMLPFQVDLQGRQMKMVDNEIQKAGEFTDEQAMRLIDTDFDKLKEYIYYTSARYIKRLGQNSYKDLYDIVFNMQEKEQVEAFNKFLSKTENIKRLQRIFPIIITTCISAHKLGKPEPMFDMVIMDEASQCNTAISLVPIIRGQNLMLVGDPQQLSPVILLDEASNKKIRQKYGVTEEYDYRKNSIYKTFLACDSVSDEVLLHNHYRCHEKIIGFNNRKYYNSKLKVCSQSTEQQPLVFVNIRNGKTDMKNTASAEVDAIVEYAVANADKSIGVITPFVNQRKLIEDKVKQRQLRNVACGTVHAFQGDEKDVVLFSTVLTEQTQIGTYNWLKNNKELINVATSRARDKLIVLADWKSLNRLHKTGEEDDLYELVQYVRQNGESVVTPKIANSRALGVKPFSTATEEAFLDNLTHALGNIWLSDNRYIVQKEVPIAQVFQTNDTHSDLFYSGRFDFVVYEYLSRQQIPVLAIELDGKEHYTDEVVKERDRKKNEICKAHNLHIIRVENSYARRYNHIKEILVGYFKVRH